ncbi:hypothetical protein ACP6EG_25580, partial [Klebsiella pneumoniae subsp. pneumoniae]
IGPDPRNFNQRVSLGRNDLLIRTFPQLFHHVLERLKEEGMLIENAQPDEGDIGSEASRESQFAGE